MKTDPPIAYMLLPVDDFIMSVDFTDADLPEGRQCFHFKGRHEFVPRVVMTLEEVARFKGRPEAIREPLGEGGPNVTDAGPL